MDETEANDFIVEQCQRGVLPKLSFLMEEHDESSLSAYFEKPTDSLPKSNGSCTNSNDVTYASPLSIAERAEILSKLLEILKADETFAWWPNLPSKSRAAVIIFLSENSSTSNLWCDQTCSNLVSDVCREVSKRVQYNEGKVSNTSNGDLTTWFEKNFEDSLTPNETDFYGILQLVKTKYNKKDWKYYPASTCGFCWILQQIPLPYLTNYLDLVIPPSLLFTDDYYSGNKMLGLRSLLHIVTNADKHDLTRNNWANVIYHAVERLCSDKDPEVISVLMTVLLKMLQIIEKDPAHHASEFTRYDELLKQILFQMEFGSDLNQKQAWLPILNNVMDKMGTATLHWSDRICGMLLDFTTCNNEKLWKSILETTNTLIKTTWLKADCESIGEIILRIIFNVSSFHAITLSKAIKEDLVQNAFSCFQLLQRCDDFEIVMAQLNEIAEKGDSAMLHPNFVSEIKELRNKLDETNQAG